MGLSRGGNAGALRRYHDERRREKLDLEDGRQLWWTVWEPAGRPAEIETFASSDRPRGWWVPHGRDYLRELGHPDGLLGATHDDAPT